MQEIVCHVSLFKKLIPALQREAFVGSEETSNIVVAPRADDAFGDIGALIVGRDILNCNFSSITKKRL